MVAPPELQLIGCEHSYFTGKVRGYLRWKGLAFDEVLPLPQGASSLPHPLPSPAPPI